MGKKIKTWSITDVVVLTLSAMKEQSRSSVTEEQRRYGQKDQDLVFNEFSGNDTSGLAMCSCPRCGCKSRRGVRSSRRCARAGGPSEAPKSWRSPQAILGMEEVD